MSFLFSLATSVFAIVGLALMLQLQPNNACSKQEEPLQVLEIAPPPDYN